MEKYSISILSDYLIFHLGTNKSGALKAVLEAFEEFESVKNTQAQFEFGTLE